MDKERANQRSATKRNSKSLKVVEFPPPPIYFRKYGEKKLTRTEKLKLFIYDPKYKTVFGRTGASWGKC